MVIRIFRRCIFYEASIRDYLYFMIISTEDLAEWACGFTNLNGTMHNGHVDFEQGLCQVDHEDLSICVV
jgi:hypothetical protein